MDKIGIDGVSAELSDNGFSAGSIEKYLELFKKLAELQKGSLAAIEYLSKTLEDYLDEEVKNNLTQIIEAVNAAKEADFELVFDPTLVRGMSYYTGTIFEIAMPEFGGSCGGGGRYDKMVGKFTGNDVPACGFSIGFERIILLLTESGFKVPGQEKKTAFLVEKGMPVDRLTGILKEARDLRNEGSKVLVVKMNKNKKFQKEQLAGEGYSEFKEFFNN